MLSAKIRKIRQVGKSEVRFPRIEIPKARKKPIRIRPPLPTRRRQALSVATDNLAEKQGWHTVC